MIQTIISPIITYLLFLYVFSLAIGTDRAPVLGHVFTTFLVPGLIAMQIIQNAFAKYLFIIDYFQGSKGNIVDFLYPPLSPGEVTSAMLLGGTTRGLIVGFSILVSILFIKVPIFSIFYIFIFALLGSLLLACIGFIAGLWADRFDNLAAVTNFIVIPLSFLSGTFFSIANLNSTLATISKFNPFFYVIDGFRYGFLGSSDSNVLHGLIIVTVCNIIAVY